MRQLFARQLNVILIDTFNVIKRVEENALRGMHKNNLSISEYHMIESVGKGGERGRTISEIASDLAITLASVTIGINKLVKKGYCVKKKSETDGRVVYVSLTRIGRKVNAGHRYYHEKMVRAVSDEFNDDELRLLIKVIEKLNNFFKVNNYFIDGSKAAVTTEEMSREAEKSEE
ncbi:MAG: MarR family transcriptional regulator [Eubacteriales bacterium]